VIYTSTALPESMMTRSMAIGQMRRGSHAVRRSGLLIFAYRALGGAGGEDAFGS